MQNIRSPITLSLKPLYVRDRVDSSLPMLLGRSCKAQTVHRPGNEWCCSSAFPKRRGSRICKLRGFSEVPNFIGCVSDSAAGNADTPHEGHQPVVPGQRQSGGVRMVQRAAPSMWSRRTTRQSLDSFQKALRLTRLRNAPPLGLWSPRKGSPDVWRWDKFEHQLPDPSCCFRRGRSTIFYVLHRMKNF